MRSAFDALRFSSLLSTAVAMNAAVAHLMELPAKRRYEPGLYVRLHRTLYWNFGRLGGRAEAIAVFTTALLAWRRRRRGAETSRATALASGGLAAAHGVFWTVVHPVNVEMLKWPLDAIPDRWTAARDRWELGHAARAVLMTGAFAALLWSLVDESPSRRALDTAA